MLPFSRDFRSSSHNSVPLRGTRDWPVSGSKTKGSGDGSQSGFNVLFPGISKVDAKRSAPWEEGRSYRLLGVIEDENREGLAMNAAFPLPAERVIRAPGGPLWRLPCLSGPQGQRVGTPKQGKQEEEGADCPYGCRSTAQKTGLWQHCGHRQESRFDAATEGGMWTRCGPKKKRVTLDR